VAVFAGAVGITSVISGVDTSLTMRLSNSEVKAPQSTGSRGTGKDRGGTSCSATSMNRCQMSEGSVGPETAPTPSTLSIGRVPSG
jgi:hypothetical protein